VKNGPKVISAVDTIIGSLSNVKEHLLKGANNPLLKAQADYGVDEHARRQSSLGCDAKEAEISSSYCTNPNPKRRDCKMDCVKVASGACTIIEIKPRGAAGLGEDQARAYEEGIRKLFAAKGSAGFDGSLSVFRSCVSNDGKEIAVSRRLELYDFCPAPEKIAPVVTDVNIAVPEDEE
jgi:hypothetical protein